MSAFSGSVNRIAALCATLFGIGYIPFAPGTCGTICSLVLCVFLPTNTILFAYIVAVIFAASIPIAYAAEKYFRIEDDGRIIIDEFVGYMIAVAFLPRSAFYFLGAFVLFRIFDIFKFSIIRKSQDLPYGIGVVVDDVLAGLAANGILQGVRLIGTIF